MDWDFTRLGVYPMEKRGLFGIFAHPLIHSNFPHLLANTLPLFFLSWCLFYFYRGIAPYIFFIIWVGCGAITYLIGKPGWHIGASGIIYGLAFFLFFSGLLRKYIPLIAISLLVSGAIMGTLCAFAFVGYGPQRPEPFEEEENENDDEEEMKIES